ncbi:PAS domain-containing sensor histidine kinase [Geobacter sp. SVR]|uniref:sensor histidine kinase n=1 Tax=Geobacter sp. SVR TaxID=2495594 RepID=UPI00143F03EF|nr:HAMP domain-containing sensor histidine kinase [Geobacter sp. SVR]BCS54885.1 two-component sensor histidine kinase [Geobacter sp. SVR]GCF87403.1 two-component sensor histidine kinase [Geobacter sp. SVR]
MFKSLTTRIIATTITLLICGIYTYTFFNVRYQQSQFIEMARESTELLLHTVESSIYNTMHLGNVQNVGSILALVGQHNQLVGVRIFHPHGIILRSANSAEVGRTVNVNDYNLYQSTKNYGIFDLAPHGEVLSMVKPIYNEPACHACHGNKARVIGILNINYSLNRTKMQMLASSRIFIFSSIAITAFLAVTISLILLKFVKRPLVSIIDNMSRVEQGDLSVRIEYRGRDEIGRLIKSFNSMVDRLDAAKHELEQMHFQQLERADRLASIGEMAAGIAHEIKNPLAGISAAISIIKDDLEGADPRAEILGEVLQQVQRLDKTVNDLLFFGKPSMPEFACIDLNSIISKTLNFASQHRSVANFEKRLILAPDLPPVYADAKQMQQVFLNIILNAVQAMPEGGTLTISTSRSTSQTRDLVKVEVADTGSGIPPQILEKIFTPFFTTKAQGTGLGLAICCKLVHLHNGEISVRSDDMHGTVFVIELPACSIETHEMRRSDEAQQDTGC